ncbi:MAG: DUF1190 domain-containing protein [Alphaproteobacteria bacterium]|nr:DUF1190 domain-containing protein [Alphaproteobacteria bacterium]
MSTSKLLLIGVGVLALTACGDDDQAADATSVPGAAVQAVYPSLDACLAEAADMEAVRLCREAAHEAQAKLEAQAPKTAADCASQYGKDCVQHTKQDGSSWWGPAFTGFLIGKLLDGSRYRAPVWTDGSGNYNTTTVKTDSRKTDTSVRSSGGTTAPKVTLPTTTVSRGGFGSTGSKYTSAGG